MNKDNVVGISRMIKGAGLYYWGKLVHYNWTALGLGIANILSGYSRHEIGKTKTSLHRIKRIGLAELQRRKG